MPVIVFVIIVLSTPRFQLVAKIDDKTKGFQSDFDIVLKKLKKGEDLGYLKALSPPSASLKHSKKEKKRPEEAEEEEEFENDEDLEEDQDVGDEKRGINYEVR